MSVSLSMSVSVSVGVGVRVGVGMGVGMVTTLIWALRGEKACDMRKRQM